MGAGVADGPGALVIENGPFSYVEEDDLVGAVLPLLSSDLPTPRQNHVSCSASQGMRRAGLDRVGVERGE